MQLDAPTQAGPPAAYFPNEGDTILVGLVNVKEYQQRDYDTGNLKTWPDGSKVMGKCVTGLVVSTTGSTAKGTEKSNEPVSPGDLVTFWCEGGKYFTYRDAVQAHGKVNVGDLMQWQRIADEPAKNSRHNDRKVHVAKLRAPTSADGDIVARCEAAHREIAGRQVDAPADEPAAAPF